MSYQRILSNPSLIKILAFLQSVLKPFPSSMALFDLFCPKNLVGKSKLLSWFIKNQSNGRGIKGSLETLFCFCPLISRVRVYLSPILWCCYLERQGGSGGTTDIYNVEAAEILANEALVRNFFNVFFLEKKNWSYGGFLFITVDFGNIRLKIFKIFNLLSIYLSCVYVCSFFRYQRRRRFTRSFFRPSRWL